MSLPIDTHLRTLTVAVVGNPNAGKTTLFNALSGLRHRVGNYPGVTVELTKGRWKTDAGPIELIDLPGTYSLAPRSPDELVAVDLLLGHAVNQPRPDAVLAVVDASNLDRHLYLITQLLELGLPVVVAVNMIDVAEKQGQRVDAAKLEQLLGVPVVVTQANRGRGVDKLASAITRAVKAGPATPPVVFPEAVVAEEADLALRLPNEESFLRRRLLFDAGGTIEHLLTRRHGDDLVRDIKSARARLDKAGSPVPSCEARARYGWIRSVTASAVVRPERPPVSATDRIDRVLTHWAAGTAIFLTVMALVFLSMFVAAVPLMDLLNAGKDTLADAVRGTLPPGPFTSLLTDGVIEGVGSVVVFLPQILILFAFLGLLEDCGYMARAAFLMDKLMARCGLSGKSFIPLLSSVACAVPGVMATRVIEQPRDRLATILVAPLMSCSARLPVYTIMVALFFPNPWVGGLVIFAMYMLGIVLAPIVAWLLKGTLLRGPTPVFVMEMPLYQWPHLKTVVLRMVDRAKAFLTRAGTVILASMIIVWALLYFPATSPDGRSYDIRIAELREQAGKADGAARDEFNARIAELNGEWKRQSLLGRMGHWIEPIVRPLGWDWKIGMAALASFPAREVVVGVLGQIYNLGADTEDLEEPLGQELKKATGDDGKPVFTAASALSVMVFFALCCQCVSTLAVIRRETGTWRWPIFTFTYMTSLAYVGALVTFQVAARFV